MDAHQPVTLKEGDRYPLGPPSFRILTANSKISLLMKPKIVSCFFCLCSLMVKKRAYTSPKHRPDKPECAGSTPARGTKYNAPMAERPNATVCKTVKPQVQILLGAPINGSVAESGLLLQS
jgi:hypothetical protein